MLTLTIRFLAGRYYATGWDHQVNEGTIEWPPAPWRLLRALVAASYRMLEPPSDARLAALIEPLAEALPVYQVPAWSEGHTRHYMPLDNKGLPGDKSALVFNAFIAPGSGADADDGVLTMAWKDVTLDDDAFSLLEALCEQLGYLGRAESWTEVIPSRSEVDVVVNCRPADDTMNGERVRLMAPARRAEHLAWVDEVTGGKKKKAGPPRSLLDVLRQDTGEIRKAGWSSVPGARWAVYDLKRARLARQVSTRVHDVLPTYALYRLKGPVMPPVTKTLQVGECFHRALVAWSCKVQRADDPMVVFKGPERSDGGDRDSGHAAVLPFDWEGDGQIRHALVHAPMGFDAAAQGALELGRTLTGVGAYKYRVTLVGLWTQQDVEQIPDRDLPPMLRKAKRWRSATPFLLTRHPKTRGDGTVKDGPADQVTRALTLRGAWNGTGTTPSVSPLSAWTNGSREIDWYRFQRARHMGLKGTRASGTGYGFEIELPEPTRGPITGGYGRYLGLGQFVPADE